MTIVFKVSDNIKEKMVKYYEDIKRDKTPPYALFQASEGGTIITLYESGKVMFQGMSADVDANIWIEQERILNKRDVNKELEEKENKKEEEKDTRFINVATIGSDEVGKGDYFGPMIVTAAYVGKEHMPLLYDLGVRDSKRLTDAKILEIAPTIIKNIPHANVILTNEEYNSSNENLNAINAKMHNKAICKLVEKGYDYKYIVIDQFCHPRLYFTYIMNEKPKCTKITFVTKAEDKALSVAAASIISRYLFLKEFDKMSDKYKIFLKKGAGLEVDKQGAMLVQKYGFDVLNKIAKLSYKNTDKIKELLK